MERTFYICNNLLGLRPRIQIKQFFKYGFAEQKMMMCCDAISRVKSLTKELKIQASLTSSRRMPSRTESRSRSPVKNMNQTALTIKHKTLAEIQEDMR